MTDWEDKTNFTQLNGETPGETEKKMQKVINKKINWNVKRDYRGYNKG